MMICISVFIIVVSVALSLKVLFMSFSLYVTLRECYGDKRINLQTKPERNNVVSMWKQLSRLFAPKLSHCPNADGGNSIKLYLSQKKYPELLNLLYKGSTLLLQRDQQGSGADLAILLIDVLTKSETKPCQEWIEKIAKLFELMNSSIPERESFLTNAVKWSMDNNKKGHPLLHKKIAEVYWQEKKYTSAHRHFLHSSDGAAYASMLIELHTTKGLKSEIDLFIAQAVLQCLCLRNIQMASEAFNKYTGSHPTIKNDKGPPYLLPLLNFLWFLLRAVEQKHVIQFKILRNCYAISIKRDPNYSVYLDTIGRIWFGIEIPQDSRNSNSVFGGLLKSIIGDVDVDSSDEDGDFMANCASVPDLD